MQVAKVFLAVGRQGYAEILNEEFHDRWQLAGEIVSGAAVAFPEGAKLPPLDETVFARQYLPRAVRLRSTEPAAVSDFVVKAMEVLTKRANRQSGRWTLHAFAIDDDPAVQLAAKLEKAVLTALKTKLPRFFKRYVEPAALTTTEPGDVVVQLYLPSVDEVWLSTGSVAAGVSPYIAGNRRVRHRAGAPSRSARKLEEAFFFLDKEPQADELAVDLGAAPGGWSFCLASYGAKVTAVDHADLALPEDKKLKGEVTHVKDNGLKYVPPLPVDWLCCDMVINPRETLRVLDHWLQQGLMRAYVVNIKLPQTKAWPIVQEALALQAKHAGSGWPVMRAKHLYHDRQEITLMGSRSL